MIIYEVNISVEQGFEEEYRNWQVAHTQQILALPGFVKAEIRQELEADSENRLRFSINYFLESREAFDNYLENYAAELRSEAIRAFGRQLVNSRRVFDVYKELEKGEAAAA